MHVNMQRFFHNRNQILPAQKIAKCKKYRGQVNKQIKMGLSHTCQNYIKFFSNFKNYTELP